MLCARDETSEESCKKKRSKRRYLSSVRYFSSSFFFSYEQERGETEKHKCLHNTKKEREREREHNTRAHHSLDFLSSSSLICIKEIERKSG